MSCWAMGRRLVDATKASRMRRTRGDMGRLRRLVAVGRAFLVEVVLVLAVEVFAADL